MESAPPLAPPEIVLGTYGSMHAVTVRGELDVATAGTLASALRHALDAAPEMVLLDLGAVTFIDAAAAHAIHRAHTLARARAVRMTILPGPETVQRVFAMAGVDTALPFASEPARKPRPRARPAHRARPATRIAR
jgi:anti-anti-sigma factor